MFVLLSSDNLSRRKKLVWRSVRWIVPRKVRWFYEGHPDVRGQLWFAERRLLYNTVRKVQPEVVFEVGTWQGGGSTLFIAQALKDNQKGKLHTIEIDPKIHQIAHNNYQKILRDLEPFVQFHVGNSKEVYPQLLHEVGRVDMLFLDGAQDAQQTLDEFHLFEPYLGAGSVIACHDWDNDKMALVRPLLESSSNWSVEERIGPPRSVGLAILIKH